MTIRPPALAPAAPAPSSAPCATPAPALKARMLRAAGWLLGSSLSSQLLRLLSNLVLTRLLLPEAFGLVAAVNTLYFALVMFSDLGVWQSVVKSARGTQERFQGTAWTVQLLRGGLLMLLVMLGAVALDWAARSGVFAAGTVFADARLPPMMAAFAVCALLQGLESIKLATAQRELQGGALAKLELASQLLALAVTLALAWGTRSPWALIAGSLVGSAARTVLSHLYLPGQAAAPCWDSDCAREIFGFGKWIFVSSIVGFLAAHGEKILLGAKLDAQSFGVFSIAATLLGAVVAVYSSLNGHVIFSSLSLALRSGQAREVERVYTRVQQLADAVLGLLAGGLLMCGQWVVWLLYDARYHAAGWMLQWLALGLLGLRHQVTEQLMFARGQSAWVSANNVLRALSLVVCIPLGFALAGERGALAGIVLSQFASWPLSLLFKQRQGLLGWANETWWLPALGLGLGAGWLLDAALGAWHH